MKTKVLKFLVQFFALCAAIAVVLTFANLWAGLAALIFIGAAMVSYLFYELSTLAKFSVFYTTEDGEQKNCIIRAKNRDDAVRKVEGLQPVQYSYHIKPNFVIQLDVDL